jgi:hypothetical protein
MDGVIKENLGRFLPPVWGRVDVALRCVLAKQGPLLLTAHTPSSSSPSLASPDSALLFVVDRQDGQDRFVEMKTRDYYSATDHGMADLDGQRHDCERS